MSGTLRITKAVTRGLKSRSTLRQRDGARRTRLVCQETPPARYQSSMTALPVAARKEFPATLNNLTRTVPSAFAANIVASLFDRISNFLYGKPIRECTK